MTRDETSTGRAMSRGTLLKGAIAAGAGVAVFDPLSAWAAQRDEAAGTPAVQVTVFSPRPGEVAGTGGAGFIVDLALDAAAGHNGSLQGFVRFIDPTDPAFGPGTNPAVEGLVVLFSTTKAFHGPQTNLANLFQITTLEVVNSNQKEIWSTWLVGKPIAGAGVDSTLTVFVVDGRAPDVVPADIKSLPIISNVVTVAFHIAA